MDARGTAILLVGGDKRGMWSRWYDDAIPAAERAYAQYLEKLGQTERKRRRDG
jgi:hypothetical protein